MFYGLFLHNIKWLFGRVVKAVDSSSTIVKMQAFEPPRSHYFLKSPHKDIYDRSQHESLSYNKASHKACSRVFKAIQVLRPLLIKFCGLKDSSYKSPIYHK